MTHLLELLKAFTDNMFLETESVFLVYLHVENIHVSNYPAIKRLSYAANCVIVHGLFVIN